MAPGPPPRLKEKLPAWAHLALLWPLSSSSTVLMGKPPTKDMQTQTGQALQSLRHVLGGRPPHSLVLYRPRDRPATHQESPCLGNWTLGPRVACRVVYKHITTKEGQVRWGVTKARSNQSVRGHGPAGQRGQEELYWNPNTHCHVAFTLPHIYST